MSSQNIQLCLALVLNGVREGTIEGQVGDALLGLLYREMKPSQRHPDQPVLKAGELKGVLIRESALWLIFRMAWTHEAGEPPPAVMAEAARLAEVDHESNH